MAAPLKHGYMYRELCVEGSNCALGVRDSLKPLGTPWDVTGRGEGAPFLAFADEGSNGHCSQVSLPRELASKWFASCGIFLQAKILKRVWPKLVSSDLVVGSK